MSSMLSDEILSLPFPALEDEFGFGFTHWPVPALAPAPAPAPAPASALEEPHRAALSQDDERRRRRKISNRDSARRSRMRKLRHLEELRSEAGRLLSENRALAGRILNTRQRFLLFRRDNQRLRAESAALRRQLSELLRFIVLRQLHLFSSPPPTPTLPPPPAAAAAAAAACGSFRAGYEQTLASLIT